MTTVLEPAGNIVEASLRASKPDAAVTEQPAAAQPAAVAPSESPPLALRLVNYATTGIAATAIALAALSYTIHTVLDAPWQVEVKTTALDGYVPARDENVAPAELDVARSVPVVIAGAPKPAAAPAVAAEAPEATSSIVEIPAPEAAAIEAAPAQEAEPLTAELEPLPEPSGGAMVISAVRVRVGPANTAPQVTVLQPGTPVTVLGMTDGWVKVGIAGGEAGWVYQRFLRMPEAPSLTP